MQDLNYMFLAVVILSSVLQLTHSTNPRLLPTYNPSTRCHDLPLPNDDLTFAICLQRAPNKQHPFNLYTSSSFCSISYPPSGRLVDVFSLSTSTIDQLSQSLINLLHTKTSHIDLPEPNFLWIESNVTQNPTDHPLWCPPECQGKTPPGKFLILKTRCLQNNVTRPCLTTKQTHWDRAPFICVTNQTIKQKKQTVPASIPISPSYPNDTIVFYDSTPCVIVRSRTHQYTFCFRRQSCPQSQTSAFCSTKLHASQICREEKNSSNLLTIENAEEYELINDVVRFYSNETLLDSNGTLKNKYIVRAQWLWIDGNRGLNDFYHWNTHDELLTPINDDYWCDRWTNCSAGKGRDHVVLNVVCQSNESNTQVCLTSRRQSEPGPFICKRTLTANEESITNYTYLRALTTITTTPSPRPITPVYEKNFTSIYYDEHHCLTVQSSSHLYSFCFRRQNCTLRKAYCTKWSQSRQDCRFLKDQAQLLTIDNEQERQLVTDTIEKYSHETRLNFNGSSYRYFQLADFLWIDGIQQADNRTYLWKNGLETIPDELWCPKDECTSVDRERVMLNLLCQKNNSAVCLGTRLEWKPAPYVCKRVRPKDQCPILFDDIRTIRSNEMLVVTVNRTVALIKCKHPEYNTEVKVQYQCDVSTSRWELIYENENFTCPDYEIPPMAISVNSSEVSTTTTVSTPMPASDFISTTQDRDCSSTDLSSIISRLPTESRYIYSYRLPSPSSLYYDMKLSCYFNELIQITYRCDLLSGQWIYVYGNTNSFNRCSPPCDDDERKAFLNKYFTQHEQSQIRIKYLSKTNSLHLRCFNQQENRWKAIHYKCGTMTISKFQWFKLHSCFQSPTTTTTLSPVMVTLSVTQLTPVCPPAVIRGSACDYQIGQYVFDVHGCVRKVCPSISRLCDTIRCPPDRVCRVITCQSCIQTEYLQAVCEYSRELSLCDLERQLSSFNDTESINRWQRQTIALVRRLANEQRQRLTSPWPVLTIH